ncbi:MAG: ABC transporter ATP-binding protein [Phaeodactylibacter sp.]|uniref:ABC transporter ATP-binding protein n=1 Tax=Phaeodactylibacter sp. TaxID=1940289 RepID=UPI0032F026DE
MLEISSLAAGYGKTLILNNIHLEAAAGEVHGVLGINGAGKTTFFKALCRLGPSFSGAVTWQGEPLSPTDIGYLPATPYFYPYQTGQEYLELCRHRNPGFPIEKWNGLFQLPLKDLTETYSTGMRKKLALLGVLAGRYKVLLLDEPFSGLDLESTEVLFEILEQLKSYGLCILLSSHILATVRQVCSRVSYLSAGQILRTFEHDDFDTLESSIKTTLQSRTKAAWAEIRKPG